MSSWFEFMDHLRQDLRYGLRMLIARPGFTLVAILSVALGIGATTAIFSVVYAVLIDPYPYRAADRIGSLFLTTKKESRFRTGYSKAQYFEVKSRMHAMEDAIAIDGDDVVLTGTGLAEVVRRGSTSTNFFEFFGVPTQLGRAFTSKDSRAGAAPEPVAVISYKFWQRVFQGRPEVLGQQIHLNNNVYTIIGVLPVRFTWMDMDVYVPMDPRPSTREFVDIIYRIREGVGQDQINAEFQPMLESFRRQSLPYMYPEDAFKVKFINVNDGILGKFQNTLLALFGAVALLLLIACANVANLLLARAATREGEMAVRVSIGATRGRLVRQLLTESVVLAVAGGLLGILLAYLGIRVVIALMPEYSIPHEAIITLNLPVLWFALATSVITGIVFGLAPALQSSNDTQASTLRESARNTSGGGGRRSLHDILMVAEITLSLVLLTGAGLAIRGLFALQGSSLGYNPQNALTFMMPLQEGRYTQWASRLALYQNVVAQLRRTPEVLSAAVSATGTPPYNGFNTKVASDDKPFSDAPKAVINLVQDGYFAAVQTKLLQGRDLTQDDITQARPVAVVSEDLVKRDFAGKDPLGHHLQLELFTQPIPPQWLKAPNFNNAFEVVGVVATARNRGLNEPAQPAVFLPYSILLPPRSFVIARTKGDPDKLISPARAAVREVDKGQPITLTRTLEEWLNTATAYPRFAAFLFGVFGTIGLVLAAAGVFSVVSYAVAHRTREFGIRMALGAEPYDVLKLVLIATGRILAAGLTLGLVVSITASRLLADRMEGMGKPDPFLFVVVPSVLIAATIAACVLPARTAIQTQPMEALRHD